MPAGAPPRGIAGHKDGIGALTFVPRRDLLAAASVDRAPKFWNVTSTAPSLANELIGHTREVLSVRFSPDERTLASAGADKSIRLWRVVDGTFLRSFTGHTGEVSSAAFSPDGEFATEASTRNKARLVGRVGPSTLRSSPATEDGSRAGIVHVPLCAFWPP
jgi:WD40 repeat protein